MRKEDLMKYAIIAGGAYLLYVYLKNSGLWDQWFGVAHPAVAPTGATTTPAVTTHPTQTPEQIAAAAAASAAAVTAAVNANATAVTAAVDQQYLERAAANSNWTAEAKGAKLTWDQWNWYLQKFAVTNGTPPQPIYGPEDVGLADRNSLLTADQYHALKSAKGLAGLGGMAPMLPYGGWAN